MDLGIRGKNAIVCASSRGLGRACAIALAREGVNVTINVRNQEALEEVVGSCSTFGVNVQSIVGDITKQSTRESLLDACPAPDIWSPIMQDQRQVKLQIGIIKLGSVL